MNLRITALWAILAALLTITSCRDSKEDYMPEEEEEVIELTLADINSTNYPTTSDTWTITDTSALTSSFEGLKGALSMVSGSITLSFPNLIAIPDEAFIVDNSKLSIVISAPNVLSIGSSAFDSSLTELEIATGDEISAIDVDAFDELNTDSVILSVGEANESDVTLALMPNTSSIEVGGTIFEFATIYIVRESGVVGGIYTITDLQRIGTNANMLDGDYVLMTTLDLSVGEWTPIGTSYSRFTGTFDGKNQSIEGMEIDNETTSYQGLFGYVEGATIKNLTIDGCDIVGYQSVGALVGYAVDSQISNCTVINSDIEGCFYVAGIAGECDGSIVENCSNSSTVLSPSNPGIVGVRVFGGIVGRAKGTTISKCANNSTIGIISDDGYVGGVVGHTFSGSKVISCYNTTDIEVDYDDSLLGSNVGYVGGVVGYADDSEFVACYNTGSADGENYTGSVCGGVSSGVSFVSCYGVGLVTNLNTDGAKVSGYIVGSIDSDATFEQCYFINRDSDTAIYGVGNKSSTTGIASVSDVAALNTKVNDMNSSISSAGYSTVSYTDGGSYLPSLLGESESLKY